MATIKEAAGEFLSQRRIAVTGVSRTPGNHGSNVVYKRLRERGYEVFAVNPNADKVEDDPAYPDLDVDSRRGRRRGDRHEARARPAARCVSART
jgi:predicted CoA-binding protein